MPSAVSERSVRDWLLLDAGRWTVTVAMASFLFGALLLPEVLDPGHARRMLSEGDPLQTLFQALVAGIVTGVTLVVTITQLVLSQELGAVGDQRERMRRAVEFQEDVEEAMDAALSPPEPAAFLRWLVGGIRERARSLGEAVPDEDGALREGVERLVRGLEAEAGPVSRRLEGSEFGTFQVIRAALGLDYSRWIHVGRSIRSEHGEGLDAEGAAALDRLLEALNFFGPAREHFKTLYFQWELTNLSRQMVYAGVPALAVAAGALLYLNPTAVETNLLGVDAAAWLVAAPTVAAMVPFVLLLSHILRIVTVTQRTLAMGPFVLRKTRGSGEILRDVGSAA